VLLLDTSELYRPNCNWHWQRPTCVGVCVIYCVSHVMYYVSIPSLSTGNNRLNATTTMKLCKLIAIQRLHDANTEIYTLCLLSSWHKAQNHTNSLCKTVNEYEAWRGTEIYHRCVKCTNLTQHKTIICSNKYD